MKILAAWIITLPLLSAQVAEKANGRYRTAEGRKGMIETLADPHRASQLRAQEFVSGLQLKPGDSAADVGSGAGVLLPFLSKAVGPGGKVFAMDIFPDFLERAKKKAQADGLANVTFILGTEHDTNLPAASCDVVVTVDAYHHFDYPADTLASIRRALRPGGRLVILDYYRRENAMGNGGLALEHIRIDRDDVKKEVESNGFQLVSSKDHVPDSQYILTFRVR